jgi:hypothetical protein
MAAHLLKLIVKNKRREKSFFLTKQKKVRDKNSFFREDKNIFFFLPWQVSWREVLKRVYGFFAENFLRFLKCCF